MEAAAARLSLAARAEEAESGRLSRMPGPLNSTVRRERLICCEICPDIKIVFINFEKGITYSYSIWTNSLCCRKYSGCASVSHLASAKERSLMYDF